MLNIDVFAYASNIFRFFGRENFGDLVRLCHYLQARHVDRAEEQTNLVSNLVFAARSNPAHKGLGGSLLIYGGRRRCFRCASLGQEYEIF